MNFVFLVLLDRLPDLILDTPEAPEILGKFISRAMLEGCLPSNFRSEELHGAGSLGNSFGREKELTLFFQLEDAWTTPRR